jgi:hypothetical protein
MKTLPLLGFVSISAINYVSMYDDHIGNVKGKATCGGPIGTGIIRVENPLTGIQTCCDISL